MLAARDRLAVAFNVRVLNMSSNEYLFKHECFDASVTPVVRIDPSDTCSNECFHILQIVRQPVEEEQALTKTLNDCKSTGNQPVEHFAAKSALNVVRITNGRKPRDVTLIAPQRRIANNNTFRAFLYAHRQLTNRSIFIVRKYLVKSSENTAKRALHSSVAGSVGIVCDELPDTARTGCDTYFTNLRRQQLRR
jgi:hypothetical protein